MSELCPFCGNDDHDEFTSGYGLAAGPLGSYTFCNKCDELIAFAADTDGLSDKHRRKLQAMQDELDRRVTAAQARRKT